MKLWTNVLETPIGGLLAAIDEDGALVHLRFAKRRNRWTLEAELALEGHEIHAGGTRCRRVEGQLATYFDGRRRAFDLVLRPPGTEFQRRVWDELAKVPFGETVTYAELARRVGQPTAVRAVGRCNALNPIVVVLPCHRVVGSDGELTGYGGGLATKRRLLQLEGVATRVRGRSRRRVVVKS